MHGLFLRSTDNGPSLSICGVLMLTGESVRRPLASLCCRYMSERGEGLSRWRMAGVEEEVGSAARKTFARSTVPLEIIQTHRERDQLIYQGTVIQIVF